jgi:transcriptional regulator with XRE-family HTH domain
MYGGKFRKDMKTMLAKNIKYLRRNNQLTQEDFANLFGLTRSAIGSYEEERASPSIETIIDISNYFKISVDSLIKTEIQICSVEEKEPTIDSGIKQVKDMVGKLEIALMDYFKAPVKIEIMLKIQSGQSES